MISAFLSIVFGFGMVMTKDELEKVNEMRQGNQYTDEDAENEINKVSVDKPKLTKYPLVTTFENGTSAEGYWTYDSIIFQLVSTLPRTSYEVNTSYGVRLTGTQFE